MRYIKEEVVKDIISQHKTDAEMMKPVIEFLVENVAFLIQIAKDSPFYGDVKALTGKNFKDIVEVVLNSDEAVFSVLCLDIQKAANELHLTNECSKVLQVLRNIRQLISKSSTSLLFSCKNSMKDQTGFTAQISQIVKQHVFSIAVQLQNEEDKAMAEAKSLREAACRDLANIQQGKSLKLEEQETYRILNKDNKMRP